LLPVNKSLIYISFIAAILINLMPFDKVTLVLRPDFVALVLLYWNIYQPQRVGMSIAFTSGLFMDVIDISIMGQHAVAYCLITFFALLLHRSGWNPGWYVYSRVVCFFIQCDRSAVLAFVVFFIGKCL